ncbi:glycosyltransferase family 4 protein [Roseivivax jejudonensis]|uniref:glycosyltransferase family 4 protein n=1 Tax=Roseivivax jejudonensis TaxID=1529041 RepID=UPI000A271434|nr:glycosyltransferase family 4 protein [Roseivivax jejudonensis]
MTRPLRILFPYPGDTVGGSHVSSLMLARMLDPARHQPVVAVHGPGLLTDYLARLGIEPMPAPRVVPPRMRPRWRQPLRVRAAAAALAPYLRAQDIDIVHTHDMRMHLAWGGAAAAAGRPHIWHQRTPAPGRHLPAFAGRADRLIAVSDFVRDSFAPPLRDRAEVIYNPFDTPRPHDRAAARARILSDLGRPDAGPIVAYVSNFSDRKRPEIFVEIARRLAARPEGADAVFPMFGTPHAPWDDAVRRAAAAAGLGERLQIMGTRFPFDPWLAGVDLLIAPARDEALGRTLIEAAMAGIPLVATDEGGNREIVLDRETGRLVPPEDPEGYAAAAADLLARPEATRAMTDAARARAARLFSADAHLAAMTEIYDSLPPRPSRAQSS